MREERRKRLTMLRQDDIKEEKNAVGTELIEDSSSTYEFNSLIGVFELPIFLMIIVNNTILL